MQTMLLYHAGYREIREPDVRFGRKNADFGQVFYLTADESLKTEHAAEELFAPPPHGFCGNIRDFQQEPGQERYYGVDGKEVFPVAECAGSKESQEGGAEGRYGFYHLAAGKAGGKAFAVDYVRK